MPNPRRLSASQKRNRKKTNKNPRLSERERRSLENKWLSGSSIEARAGLLYGELPELLRKERVKELSLKERRELQWIRENVLKKK